VRWILVIGLACVATVSLAQPSTVPQGSLSRESIRTTIGAALGRVGACYDANRGTTELHGRVVVQFIILSDGTVQPPPHVLENALAPAGADADRVALCISLVVATLRFERPTGDGVVGVNYPFVL
jgi:hypothetical protein